MKKQRQFKKSKLPMARTKVDSAQNKKLENIQKQIKDMTNDIEIKYKDTLHNGLAMSPVFTPILLNGMQQGITSGTVSGTTVARIGDKVQATSMQFRGRVISDSGLLTACVWRIIIFWDRNPNGVGPAVTDVLDMSTITSASASTVYAPYNLRNSPRFKILHDETGVLNPNTDYTYGAGAVLTYVPNSSRYIKFKIPLKRVTNYGLSNAGTVADVSNNGLFGLYLSDKNAGGSPPVLNAGIRFLFKDL